MRAVDLLRDSASFFRASRAVLYTLVQFSLISWSYACIHILPVAEVEHASPPRKSLLVQPVRAGKADVPFAFRMFLTKSESPRVRGMASWLTESAVTSAHLPQQNFLEDKALRLLILLGIDGPTALSSWLAPYVDLCEESYLRCLVVTADEKIPDELFAEKAVSAPIHLITVSSKDMGKILSLYLPSEEIDGRMLLFNHEGRLLGHVPLPQTREEFAELSAELLVFNSRQQSRPSCRAERFIPSKVYQQTVFDKTARRVKISKVLPKESPILINFWATWCEPCLAEIPIIEDLERRFGKTVSFIGVLDQTPHAENRSELEALTKDLSGQYRAFQYFEPTDLPMTKHLFSEREAAILPRFALLDKNGGLVKTIIGSLENEANERDIVAALECLSQEQ